MSNFINFKSEEILINVDMIACVTTDENRCIITMIQMFKEYPDEAFPRAIKFWITIPYDTLIARIQSAKNISEV
jgi:hypothetical protein